MKRGIYAAISLSILGAGLWALLRTHDKKIDTQITSAVLPPEDEARINFDPKRETITVMDRGNGNVVGGGHNVRDVQGRVRTTYIGPHPARIDIDKTGRVSVTVRKIGTEVSPYLGMALGSDFRFRVGLGATLFYVQRWELGGGLIVSPTQIKDIRPYVAVSYNVYSNWLIGAGVDNHKAVQLIASVRF